MHIYIYIYIYIYMYMYIYIYTYIYVYIGSFMLFAMLQCFVLFVFLLTGNILLHVFILVI